MQVALKFQTTGQCEQAPRMNRSGRKTWLQGRCVVQNQGGLGSQVPGGFGSSTWRNMDLQPEINCLLIATREAKILEQDQDGIRKSNQLSRRAQEVNCPVEPAWSPGFMLWYDKNCALDWNYWSLRSLRLIWLVRVLLKLTPSSPDDWVNEKGLREDVKNQNGTPPPVFEKIKGGSKKFRFGWFLHP